VIPESDIRVRLESVRVGQILTFVVCAGAEAYALATWDRPHRVLVTVLLALGAVVGALLSLLPVERIVRGPHRENWFLGWSVLDLGLIAAIAAADGGSHSPYVFLFVLPTIFAALSYPRWSTFVTGALALVGFAIVAATGHGASLAYDLFIAFALACTGLLASWQAQNAGQVRTALTRSVEALSVSERQARTVLDTVHDAYVAMDGAGRIVDWNEHAERLFGWPRDEVIGSTVADTIIPPHFREMHLRGLEHYVATGEGPVLNKRIELSALHRDGQEFPVELTIGPVRHGGGVTFHAFLHDIRERKEGEAALRRSEMELRRNRRRLEQAQAMAHIGSWEWDVRTNRVTWSAELYRIYGVERDQFAGTFEGYLERVHPNDRENVQATLGRAMADLQPFALEERIMRPNGELRVLDSRGEVQLDNDGQVVRMIGVSQDVTERRREVTQTQLLGRPEDVGSTPLE
jgi:PAS domain S-box-containing protein